METSEINNGIYGNLCEGLDLVWSNKFTEADIFFSKYKDVSPRHALHYGEAMAFRSFISEAIPDRESAIERLTSAIKLAEENVKILENGQIPKGRNDITKDNRKNHLLDAKIVLADAYTTLSGLQMVEEQRVKGLLNLRRGWKIYRHSLNSIEDPSYDPAVISSLKFGAGLFYFIISQIPPGIPQKAAALAGFSGGDKDLGLKYLREAYQAGSIRSWLSGVVLAAHHVFLGADLDPAAAKDLIAEAESIINSGAKKYPEGSVFQAVSGVISLETNQVDAAMLETNIAIKNCQHITNYPATFLRSLSNCYSMRFDWNATVEILEKILQQGLEQEKKVKSKNPWAFVWNSIRLGSCNIMLGRDAEAKKNFQNVINAKGKDTWSELLTFQARKYLNNGGQFSMFELMYLTGHLEKVLNHTKDSWRNEIMETLDNLARKAPGALVKPSFKEDKGFLSLFSSKPGKDGFNDPKIDNRVTYLAHKAIILRSMKNKDEAIGCINEILSLEKQLVDKLYYVVALIEYGKILSVDNPDAAIKQWEIAMKFNGFTWENALKTRIRTSMKQLGVEVKVAEEVSDEKLLSESEDLRELMKAEAEEDSKEQ